MRIIDRFLQYIEHKGISENKATIDCGLSQGLLHQAKSGKSDLGHKSIDKISKQYQDLNISWLRTGEGEMLLNNKKNDEEIIQQHSSTIEQDTIQHRSLLRSVWEPESEEYEFKRIEFLPDTVCRLSVPIGVLWDKSPIMGSYNDTNYPYVLIYIPEEETGRPDEKRKLLFASDDLSVTVYGGRNAWGALHETIYRKQRFVAELE